MECPNCGKENKDTAKFCTGCGTSLTAAELNRDEVTFIDPEDEKTVILQDFEDDKTTILHDYENEETVVLNDFENEETEILRDFEDEKTTIIDDFENEETVILEDERGISLSKEDIPDFDYRGAVPVFKEDVSGTFHDTAYIDHLRALKQLLDDGIITEDEFTRKKQQILGI